MIDFSTLISLEIPEGEVVQIADANGNVLWKAEATVTITSISAFYYTPQRHLWLDINGTQYDEVSWLSPVEITVPIGTVIKCCYNAASTTNKIYLNDTVIAEGVESYDYTVTGDISIEGSLSVTGGGMGSPGSVSERYFKITEL